MAPPTGRERLLYVSTESTHRIEGERIRVVSPSALAGDDDPPAAEWILVDASVLGAEPPAWFETLEGQICLLTSQSEGLPEWVRERDFPQFDSNLVPLVRSVVEDVVDDRLVPGGTPDGGPAVERGRAHDARESSPQSSPESSPQSSPESSTESSPQSPPEPPNLADTAAHTGDSPSSPSPFPPSVEATTGLGLDDGAVATSLVGLPYPVALLDIEGVVRWTNPAWREFGSENGRPLTSADLGTDYLSMSDAADDDYATHAATAIRAVLAGESTGERVEYPCHGDETDRWYAMDVTPVEGPGPVRAVVSHVDVTHYKQRINVLDRVLRHNLRNKANIILGHAAALASSRDSETSTAATTIGAAARELLSLSEQARKYQEVRVDDEAPATIDVNGVVRDVTERIAESYPTAVIETSLPPTAFARGARSVSLVVRELLENAVAHNDSEEPWVRVEVTTDNGVSILVADDGPGIPDPDRSLLTGAAVEKPVRHGSQLGVWVVNSLVRSLGGRIDVYDRSPRGSVVTVTLPGVELTEETEPRDSRV